MASRRFPRNLDRDNHPVTPQTGSIARDLPDDPSAAVEARVRRSRLHREGRERRARRTTPTDPEIAGLMAPRRRSDAPRGLAAISGAPAPPAGSLHSYEWSTPVALASSLPSDYPPLGVRVTSAADNVLSHKRWGPAPALGPLQAEPGPRAPAAADDDAAAWDPTTAPRYRSRFMVNGREEFSTAVDRLGRLYSPTAVGLTMQALIRALTVRNLRPGHAPQPLPPQPPSSHLHQLAPSPIRAQRRGPNRLITPSPAALGPRGGRGTGEHLASWNPQPDELTREELELLSAPGPRLIGDGGDPYVRQQSDVWLDEIWARSASGSRWRPPGSCAVEDDAARAATVAAVERYWQRVGARAHASSLMPPAHDWTSIALLTAVDAHDNGSQEWGAFAGDDDDDDDDDEAGAGAFLPVGAWGEDLWDDEDHGSNGSGSERQRPVTKHAPLPSVDELRAMRALFSEEPASEGPVRTRQAAHTTGVERDQVVDQIMLRPPRTRVLRVEPKFDLRSLAGHKWRPQNTSEGLAEAERERERRAVRRYQQLVRRATARPTTYATNTTAGCSRLPARLRRLALRLADEVRALHFNALRRAMVDYELLEPGAARGLRMPPPALRGACCEPQPVPSLYQGRAWRVERCTGVPRERVRDAAGLVLQRWRHGHPSLVALQALWLHGDEANQTFAFNEMRSFDISSEDVQRVMPLPVERFCDLVHDQCRDFRSYLEAVWVPLVAHVLSETLLAARTALRSAAVQRKETEIAVQELRADNIISAEAEAYRQEITRRLLARIKGAVPVLKLREADGPKLAQQPDAGAQDDEAAKLERWLFLAECKALRHAQLGTRSDPPPPPQSGIPAGPQELNLLQQREDADDVVRRCATEIVGVLETSTALLSRQLRSLLEASIADVVGFFQSYLPNAFQRRHHRVGLQLLCASAGSRSCWRVLVGAVLHAEGVAAFGDALERLEQAPTADEAFVQTQQEVLDIRRRAAERAQRRAEVLAATGALPAADEHGQGVEADPMLVRFFHAIPEPPGNAKAAFVLKIVRDTGAELHFQPPLEHIEDMVCRSLDAMAQCTTEFPTADAHMTPPLRVARIKPSLLPCDMTGREAWLAEQKRVVCTVIARYSREPKHLLRCLSDHASLFDGWEDARVRTILRARAQSGRGVPESCERLVAEVQGFLHSARVIRERLPDFVYLPLFKIDLHSVRDEFAAKATTLANKLYEVLEADNRAQISTLREEYEEMALRLLRAPSNSFELKMLEEYCLTVDRKSKALQGLLEREICVRVRLLARVKPIGEQHTKEFTDAFLWPERMRRTKKESERMQARTFASFSDALNQSRGGLVETVSVISRDTAHLSQLGSLTSKDVVEHNNRLAALRGVLTEAKDEVERIAEEEERLAKQDTQVTEQARADLQNMDRSIAKFEDLWGTVKTYQESRRDWLLRPLLELNAATIRVQAEGMLALMSVSFQTFNDAEPGCKPALAAKRTKQAIQAFLIEDAPLMSLLCNPGLRERHWRQIEAATGIAIPKSRRGDREYNLKQVVSLGLDKKLDELEPICQAAFKEYLLEQALDRMQSDWESLQVRLVEPFPKQFKVANVDDMVLMADGHLMEARSILKNPHVAVFLQRTQTLLQTLLEFRKRLDLWVQVQTDWFELFPIFSTLEGEPGLEDEYSLCLVVRDAWGAIVQDARDKQQALRMGRDKQDALQMCVVRLEMMRSGISKLLAVKRRCFPRFYFLSQDDLIAVLSAAQRPEAIQLHVRKCFDGVELLDFERQDGTPWDGGPGNCHVAGLISPEGEALNFDFSRLAMAPIVVSNTPVEEWLVRVERAMQGSLRYGINASVFDRTRRPKLEWQQRWPAQVVLVTTQIKWCVDVEQAFAADATQDGQKVLAYLLTHMTGELMELTAATRNARAGGGTRKLLETLVCQELYNVERTRALLAQGVVGTHDFGWEMQLRFRWTVGADSLDGKKDSVQVHCMHSHAKYAYEFLGNAQRLIITPLTERCHRAVFVALGLHQGVCAQGPSSTGKTETLRDLGRAIGVNTLMFNCSDGLNFEGLLHLFLGTYGSGSWLVLDELARLSTNMLSAVALVLQCVRIAAQSGARVFSVDGRDEARLVAPAATFMTMNPGYVGRSQLPDNLRVAFRPVCMSFPDYSTICRVRLHAAGFADAARLGHKLVDLCSLCGSLLATEPHYQQGLRTVVTVLNLATATDAHVRETPAEEQEVLRRAFRVALTPLLLRKDAAAFEALLESALGEAPPGSDDPDPFDRAVDLLCRTAPLVPSPRFTSKIRQLNESLKSRVAVIQLGPALTGKSATLEVLADVMRQGARDLGGGEVTLARINPKSMSLEALFGTFAPGDDGAELWQDGALSALLREASLSLVRHWIVLDGPLDTAWAENLNSMLDDNRKLCLVNGEVIHSTPTTRVVFETDALHAAAPSTITRCAVVSYEPAVVTWDAIFSRWLGGFRRSTQRASVTELVSDDSISLSNDDRAYLQRLFDWLLLPTMLFAEQAGQSLPTSEAHMTLSVLALLTAQLHEEAVHKAKLRQEAVKKMMTEKRVQHDASLDEALELMNSTSAATRALVSSSSSSSSSSSVDGESSEDEAFVEEKRDEEKEDAEEEEEEEGGAEKKQGAEAEESAKKENGGRRMSTVTTAPIAPVISQTDQVAQRHANLAGAVLFSLLWGVGNFSEERDRQSFSNFLRGIVAAPSSIQHDQPVVFRKLKAREWAPPESDRKQLVPLDLHVPQELQLDHLHALGYSMVERAWFRWVPVMSRPSIADDANVMNLVLPTAFTAQVHYLLQLMLPQERPVLLSAPDGTGKTLTVTDFFHRTELERQLVHTDMSVIEPMYMCCVANTDCGAVQSSIEAKVSRRGQGRYGPLLGQTLVVFVDDVHLLVPREFGCNPPLELLRQVSTQGGWYSPGDTVFRAVEDTRLVVACAPQTHHHLPARFSNSMQHMVFPAMDDETVLNIFGAITTWHLSRANPSSGVHFPASVLKIVEPLVQATLRVMRKCQELFVPTPLRAHYRYNVRNLHNVLNGVVQLPGEVTVSGTTVQKVVRLWVHECQHVFGDRLVEEEERRALDALLRRIIRDEFDERPRTVMEPALAAGRVGIAAAEASSPAVGALSLSAIAMAKQRAREAIANTLAKNGNSSSSEADDESDQDRQRAAIAEEEKDLMRRARFASFLSSNPKAKKVVRETTPDEIEQALRVGAGRYNRHAREPVALFPYAVAHVCRIARSLCIPGGHVALIGLNGSGRQTLARLAGHLTGCKMFQVRGAADYTRSQWHADLKMLLTKAVLLQKPICLLVSDAQIVDDMILEDIHTMLNGGELSEVFSADELTTIGLQLRATLRAKSKLEGQEQQAGGDLSDEMSAGELLQIVWARIKRFVHLALALDPQHSEYHRRLSMFPAMLYCCHVDYFAPWPRDALVAVADTCLRELTREVAGDMDPVINAMASIHEGMWRLLPTPRALMGVLQRPHYVTPQQFVEFLDNFKMVYRRREAVLAGRLEHYETGVAKLKFAKSQVATMEDELRALQPLLEAASADIDRLMAEMELRRPGIEASRVELMAATDLAEADKAACEQAKQLIEVDLEEAMPILVEALEALDTLRPIDINEVRSLRTPPAGVRLVMEAVCIMLEEKPAKLVDPRTARQILDFWPTSVKVLGNPKLLTVLRDYDKDHIPERIIRQIRTKFLPNPGFTPAAVAKASCAAEGLCKWVRAMEVYHRTVEFVRPKQQALDRARTELNAKMLALLSKQKAFEEIAGALVQLEAEHAAALRSKADKEAQVALCKLKLQRATTLIGSFGQESDRWQARVDGLQDSLDRLLGDATLSAGCMAYLGAFPKELRGDTFAEWAVLAEKEGVACSPDASVSTTLGNEVEVRQWHVNGLPLDAFSVESAIMVFNCRHTPLLMDPTSQAQAWLVRQLGTHEQLEAINVVDPQLEPKLVSAAKLGVIALVTGLTEDLPAFALPLLEHCALPGTTKPGEAAAAEGGGGGGGDEAEGFVKVKVSGSVVPVHPDFRMYLCAKVRNPQLSPEFASRTTLLNFEVADAALFEQLLVRTVAAKRPDLEAKKEETLRRVADTTQQLSDYEDVILETLSSVEGNILEDERAVQQLRETKMLATAVLAEHLELAETMREVEAATQVYVPMAQRGCDVYQALHGLQFLERLYQFSLSWYGQEYERCVLEDTSLLDCDSEIAAAVTLLTERLCRVVANALVASARELFVHRLALRLANARGEVSRQALAFMYNPPSSGELAGRPEEVFSPQQWLWMVRLGELPTQEFEGLATTALTDSVLLQWSRFLADARDDLPDVWDSSLSECRKLVLTRLLKPERFREQAAAVARRVLGHAVVTTEPELNEALELTQACCPVVVVAHPGVDYVQLLGEVAASRSPRQPVQFVSLSPSETETAMATVAAARHSGAWVVLQNCDLVLPWLHLLDQFVDGLEPRNTNDDFRLWLLAAPGTPLPSSLVLRSVKVAVERPPGLRARLLHALSADVDGAAFDSGTMQYRRLCVGLCFFHALLLERRAFGTLGWASPLNFTQSDLRASLAHLDRLFRSSSGEASGGGDIDVERLLHALRYCVGDLTYDVADAQDKARLQLTLGRFVNADVFETDAQLSPCTQYPVPEDGPRGAYMAWVRSLPAAASSDVFGLHDLAEAERQARVSVSMLADLSVVSGAGVAAPHLEDLGLASTENIQAMMRRLPESLNARDRKDPEFHSLHERVMRGVLLQECAQYDALLEALRRSLHDAYFALTGVLPLSPDIAATLAAVDRGEVPEQWRGAAYLTELPLAAFLTDLDGRVAFMRHWLNQGDTPDQLWPGAFFDFSRVLLAVRQEFARQNNMCLADVGLAQTLAVTIESELAFIVTGLCLEGGRWDVNSRALVDCSRHALREDFPVDMVFEPCPLDMQEDVAQRSGPGPVVAVPFFRTAARAGAMRLLGQSSNYLCSILLPSQQGPVFWAERSTAFFPAPWRSTSS